MNFPTTLKTLRSERQRLHDQLQLLDTAINLIDAVGPRSARTRTFFALRRRKMAAAQRARWAKRRKRRQLAAYQTGFLVYSVSWPITMCKSRFNKGFLTKQVDMTDRDRPIRILTASTDKHLNRARALLLEYHGFQVTACESKEEAHQEIERSPYDVLIFGSTLPRDTCWELAGLFRKRNRWGKIVEIIPAPWAVPKNQPDATVVSGDEPAKLIHVIRTQSSMPE